MQQNTTFIYSELLTLPEDIINAPILDAFKARVDHCWPSRKFIRNHKTRTISKTMKEMQTLTLKGPDAYAQ